PLNLREPQAPVGVGPPPSHLSVESQAVWEELAPRPALAATVTIRDVTALELLVDCVAQYRLHRAKPGHEAFAAGYWKRLVRILPEFGCTPSSRSRLVAAPAVAPDSFEILVY